MLSQTRDTGFGRVEALGINALWAMANDPELNIGNNIGMRETVFPHVFAKNIVKSP